MQRHASAVALAAVALWALVTTATAQNTVVVAGEIQRYTVHVPADLDGNSFFLSYDPGTGQQVTQRLLFQNQPDLTTGDAINATVRVASPAVRSFASNAFVLAANEEDDVLVVDDYQKTGDAPGKDFTDQEGAINYTSITYLVTICGQKSVADVNLFKSRWVNHYNPNAGTVFGTLQNYYQECSFGKGRFTYPDNIVVDLTSKDLGCNGYWNGRPWYSSSCGTNEIFGWLQVAQAYATQLGYDWTKYSRQVVVIPANSCPWAGLGSVGCAANCFTWVKGSYATTQYVTSFHELGHNMGLQHATTPGNEYGDGSSALGGCCGDRCLNAPNSWQVNWATPITILNATNFTPGRRYAYAIPALSRSAKNHVQVVPTWNNGATTPAYFISYRDNYQWDSFLLSQYIGGVSVHIYNGSQQVQAFKSELQGVLSVGTVYRVPSLSFLYKFTGSNGTHASGFLCRYTQTVETSCTDGLDNDCDGLTDAEDPDCKGRIPPAVQTCVVNGVCESPRENYWNCPKDCKPVCGDRICAGTETAKSCPRDCPAVCGDCFCDSYRGETALTCPFDCPAKCSDGFCDYRRGETAANCIPDCPVVCGDGICNARRTPSETPNNCPQDCPAVCGDGLCSSNSGETSMSCPADCPVVCGDRFCDTQHGELQSCPRDCRFGLSPPVRLSPPPPRPPGFKAPRPPPCSANRSAFSPPPPFPPGTVLPRPPVRVTGRKLIDEEELAIAGADHEEHHAALDDAILQPVCGDDICHHHESAKSCPRDCAAVCGDGFCDKRRHETPLTCAKDCPYEKCGDGICGVSETEHSCSEDCCPKPQCGDKVCQMYAGENCMTCPQDCAGSSEAGFCCGAFISCAKTACNSNGFKCVNDCGSLTHDQ